MASIIEVAGVAGVLKSTISHVINKTTSVRPNIAMVGEDAMRQIRYQPPVRRRDPKPFASKGCAPDISHWFQ